MKKLLATIFLKVTGWKCTIVATDEMLRSVMLAAPHTSNWDFPYAMATFWYMQVDVKYFIKDSYTKGPLGPFFKWTGAIGVDRSKKVNNLTDYAIDQFNNHDRLVLIVPAEGTRKRVDKWRTGFYRIATEAQVPVSLGFLDFKKKISGVAEVYHLSGDFEKDMQHIQEIYRPINPKVPENYNPEIY